VGNYQKERGNQKIKKYQKEKEKEKKVKV